MIGLQHPQPPCLEQLQKYSKSRFWVGWTMDVMMILDMCSENLCFVSLLKSPLQGRKWCWNHAGQWFLTPYRLGNLVLKVDVRTVGLISLYIYNRASPNHVLAGSGLCGAEEYMWGLSCLISNLPQTHLKVSQRFAKHSHLQSDHSKLIQNILVSQLVTVWQTVQTVMYWSLSLSLQVILVDMVKTSCAWCSYSIFPSMLFEHWNKASAQDKACLLKVIIWALFGPFCALNARVSFWQIGRWFE